ncbi:hypothetical protein HRbin08_00022 [bacterium HR08]|nr:hypothetical protein HRbin08_00022 [bacterium HR08]
MPAARTERLKRLALIAGVIIAGMAKTDLLVERGAIVAAQLKSREVKQPPEIPLGPDGKYALETCTRCHEASRWEIEASVHGPEFLRRKGISAEKAREITCLTCHDSHGKSEFAAANFPITSGRDVATCSKCHGRERWVFFNHFHGKYFALKKRNIPTCTYCHVGHELPRDNPISPINVANVGRICAGCHGGSDEQAKVIMAANLGTPSTSRALYRKNLFGIGWLALPIKAFYSLLTVVILLFGFTCLRELYYTLKGDLSPSTSGLFTGWLAVQTILLFMFYTLLDSSGITLLYAYTHGDLISNVMIRITEPLRQFFGSADARSLMHRLAGLALILGFTGHVIYLAMHRDVFRRLRIQREDLRQAFDELRRRKPPETDWKVKVAYWLVTFLVAVMLLTGVGEWAAFELMKYVSYQVVEYNNLIHEWNGRTLSLFLYGIVVFFFGLLRPLAIRLGRWVSGREMPTRERR